MTGQESRANKKSALKVKTIAITAIFTALTTVATIVFWVPIPASGGFFNIGECIIYIAALVFGPFVGGFAGGVGAALGDLLLGYTAYAPGTLAIKFAEGWIVGYLFNKLKQLNPPVATLKLDEQVGTDTVKVLATGFVVSGIIVSFGWIFMPADLVLWLIIAATIITTTVLATYWIRVQVLHLYLSLAAGLTVMVLGYMFYGVYVFTGLSTLIEGGSGWPLNYGALAEVPVNIIQCFVGIVIAIPVYQVLSKSGLLETFAIDL